MAAHDVPGFRRSYLASGDLSASQFRAVNLNSSGKVVAIAAVTNRFIGVLENKPDAADKAATVMTSGVAMMETSEAITAGDNIYLSANGRASKTATGTANFIGVAETSAASGNLVAVLLAPGPRAATA